MNKKDVLPIIKLALKEDIGRGDITTRLLVPPGKKLKSIIVVKEEGILCGIDVAREVFKNVDKKIIFRSLKNDGKKVVSGDILARVQGNALSILKAERVSLNFLSRLSGVATEAARFVKKVKPYKVKILDTRKTTPGLRILEKYAVRCGGGCNHRMGLWDQILIKDNHLGVVARASTANRRFLLTDIIKRIKKRKPKRMKIEVEVKSLREFEVALLAKPDIIMLDNFQLKEMQEAVELRNRIWHKEKGKPLLEVSGGISLDNIAAVAATGVERISIGALTHSARALDIALNCE